MNNVKYLTSLVFNLVNLIMTTKVICDVGSGSLLDVSVGCCVSNSHQSTENKHARVHGDGSDEQ